MIVHVGLPRTGSTFLQKEVFAKIGHLHNFLSDETLVGDIFYGDIDEFYSKMEGLKSEFGIERVIIVERKHMTWIPSLYKQYVKQGGRRSFEVWGRGLDQRWFDVEGIIEYLNDEVAEVISFDYEHLVRDPEEFIRLFCKYACINVPEYVLRSHNVSWSDKRTETMRLLNCMFWWYPKRLRFWYPDQYPPRWLLTKINYNHRL